MKYKVIFGTAALAALVACQAPSGVSEAPTNAKPQNVQSAIEARQSDFDGVHHAALESSAFYEAICKMTSEAEIRSYYSLKGYNMSSDGTGATAIAALRGEPFVGRMPTKAAAWLRGCRGRHS